MHDPKRFLRRIRLALLLAAAAIGVLLCAISWWPPARMAAKITHARIERVFPQKVDLNAARARLAPLLAPGTTFPLPNTRVQVDKQHRRATLFSGDRPIKTYKIALGSSPLGHKFKSGDGRTPEGTYYICTRLSRTDYLFLGINYPNAADADRGEKTGLITHATGQALLLADKTRSAPDWNTPLGGAIGLHTGSTATDWTAGCIALDNLAIEEIWVATDYWTPVVIRQ